MIETFFSASGSTALTSTGCTPPLWVSMPCSWLNGATATTSGCLATWLASACQSSIGW
ncbi:hypothetical protein D3C75_1076060 [compost metagenome]